MNGPNHSWKKSIPPIQSSTLRLAFWNHSFYRSGEEPTQRMYLCISIQICIYIYIHTQHMYISEYVYSGFNPSQNLKTMSQMELLIPCRIGCASFNSFDQWGAFPIHHRFTYTLIFNEYHSGVTRMISTIVRPNIYWIYTYISISIYLYQWIMTLGCQDIPSRKSLFAAALRKPGRPLGSDPLLCQTYQIAFAWLT